MRSGEGRRIKENVKATQNEVRENSNNGEGKLRREENVQLEMMCGEDKKRKDDADDAEKQYKP